MSSKKLSLFLFALTLLASGCAIRVKNTKACSVAGVMSAGAECAWTLSDETERMNLDQFLDFLEPNSERAGAICQSAEDWNSMKTSLEQLCKKYRCSYEVRRQIKAAGKRINAIARKR